MKKNWAALCLAVISISCHKNENLTREEAIAAVERFDTGWKNKSQSITDSILSPAYVYFTQSGGTFSRTNILKTVASTDYQLETVERKTIDTRLSGNTAVINTTWIGKGIYLGQPFSDTQRCSVTVVKEKGKVTILSEHCTLIK